MTAPESTPAAPPEAAGAERWCVLFIVVLIIAFGISAIVGAYLDWLWWPHYSGLTITIAAVPILLVGAIAAALGHGLVRRIALVVAAVGVGLLAGQNLGPSRAPLLYAEGSISVALDGAIIATAVGKADCRLVADGSEISVSGDPNLRLDTPDRPFLSVYFDKGDRWAAIGSRARANGVALEISFTPEAVPDDGKPGTIGMAADATSTIETDFNATGGVIRFADLVPLAGADYTGEATDLSGTIEFICGEPVE